MKEQVLEFLSQRIFCVMSTVRADNTKPEAAFVGYRHSKDFEFLIGTSKLTRKYQNLQANPHVAIVVADTVGEVQYEGDAEIIDKQAYDELVAGGTFEALPGADKYREDPNEIYLYIKPTWIRFIKHAEADQVTEMTEF